MSFHAFWLGGGNAFGTGAPVAASAGGAPVAFAGCAFGLAAFAGCAGGLPRIGEAAFAGFGFFDGVSGSCFTAAAGRFFEPMAAKTRLS